jgi:cardiolipin synthase
MSNNSKSEENRKILIYDNTDEYWNKLWNKIDKAEDSIFFLTYCMDNQFIANYTLIKLIKALERGVPVILMIEHLNYFPKRKLLVEFQIKGGIVIKPNNAEKIVKHIKNKEIRKFFNRYHQKLYLVDKDLFIGSSNLANEYSSTHYGNFSFQDLNMYVKNTPTYNRIINLFYRYLIENKDQLTELNSKTYKKLQEGVFNTYNDKDFEQLIKEASDEFKGLKDEMFLEEKPPELSEIQDTIYSMIQSAERDIVIIQPYYVRLKKVDDMLIEAKRRGVNVKLITAFNRDQPAYKHLYNSELFGHLIKENIRIEEYMYKYLHMKAYYVDGKYLTIGSMNNDITSFIMNNESNYYLKKNEKNKETFKNFEELVERVSQNSREVCFQPYVSFNLFRWINNKWWHFFIWSMEKTVPNRKIDK